MLNRRLELPSNRISQGCNPLVLVVDDNEDNIIYACGSLELSNCQHIVATNAQTALDLARDKMPDLILMDIVMPEVDGISLLGILRNNLATSRIPIIATTGLAFPHHKEQLLSAGFDDYLCKPYLIEDLSSKIALLLSHHSKSLVSQSTN